MGAKAPVVVPTASRVPPENASTIGTTRPRGFFQTFQQEAIARAAAVGGAIPRQSSAIAPPIATPQRQSATYAAAAAAGDRARAAAKGGY